MYKWMKGDKQETEDKAKVNWSSMRPETKTLQSILKKQNRSHDEDGEYGDDKDDKSGDDPILRIKNDQMMSHDE